MSEGKAGKPWGIRLGLAPHRDFVAVHLSVASAESRNVAILSMQSICSSCRMRKEVRSYVDLCNNLGEE